MSVNVDSTDAPTTPGGKSILTDREVKLMGTAWQCFKNDPEIDMDKLAGLMGYTNPKSCGNAVRAIKKKIFEVSGAVNGSAVATTQKTPASAKPKPKATPRKAAGSAPKAPASKRKRAKKASEEEPVEDQDKAEEESTPAKKFKKDISKGDDDEDELASEQTTKNEAAEDADVEDAA